VIHYQVMSRFKYWKRLECDTLYEWTREKQGLEPIPVTMLIGYDVHVYIGRWLKTGELFVLAPPTEFWDVPQDRFTKDRG